MQLSQAMYSSVGKIRCLLSGSVTGWGPQEPDPEMETVVEEKEKKRLETQSCNAHPKKDSSPRSCPR